MGFVVFLINDNFLVGTSYYGFTLDPCITHIYCNSTVAILPWSWYGGLWLYWLHEMFFEELVGGYTRALLVFASFCSMISWILYLASRALFCYALMKFFGLCFICQDLFSFLRYDDEVKFQKMDIYFHIWWRILCPVTVKYTFWPLFIYVMFYVVKWLESEWAEWK